MMNPNKNDQNNKHSSNHNRNKDIQRRDSKNVTLWIFGARSLCVSEVNSAVTGSDYAYNVYSGTSMATPH
eukprot:178528-Amphidinium_carterae.1